MWRSLVAVFVLVLSGCSSGTGLVSAVPNVATSGTSSGANGTSTASAPAPIQLVSGPTSALPGNPIGVDLYTTDKSSPVGYQGVVVYKEVGYPLSVLGAEACKTFATVVGSYNMTDGTTSFTATAIDHPSAGKCQLTVTDNNPLQQSMPTFWVDYTSFSVGVSGKFRR